MSTRPASFVVQLQSYLHWGELAALILFVVFWALTYTGTDASQGIMIALSALAAIYFLKAYMPPKQDAPAPDAKEEKRGFFELLSTTILPKVLWIACSVSVIGLLFYLLNLEGFKNMLMIGGMTLSIGLLLAVGAMVTGASTGSSNTTALLRVVPLLLIDLYLLLL